MFNWDFNSIKKPVPNYNFTVTSSYVYEIIELLMVNEDI